MPIVLGSSPNAKYEIGIRNKGVNAKKGSVSDKGDCWMDFTYKKSATISSGISINKITQNIISRLGTSTKGKINNKNKDANPNLDQTSSIVFSFIKYFFKSASEVATEKPLKIDKIAHIILFQTP